MPIIFEKYIPDEDHSTEIRTVIVTKNSLKIKPLSTEESNSIKNETCDNANVFFHNIFQNNDKVFISFNDVSIEEKKDFFTSLSRIFKEDSQFTNMSKQKFVELCQEDYDLLHVKKSTWNFFNSGQTNRHSQEDIGKPIAAATIEKTIPTRSKMEVHIPSFTQENDIAQEPEVKRVPMSNIMNKSLSKSSKSNTENVKMPAIEETSPNQERYISPKPYDSKDSTKKNQDIDEQYSSKKQEGFSGKLKFKFRNRSKDSTKSHMPEKEYAGDDSLLGLDKIKRPSTIINNPEVQQQESTIRSL